MSSDRSAFELPLLLAAAFRMLIDDLHAELSTLGHPDVRPVHGFALQAVGPDGTTISELGRRLGVSKQAAAKTSDGLERLGYLRRERDAVDLRAWRLRRTERGEEFLALSAERFERLRERWIERLGAERVRAIEDDLELIVDGPAGAKLGDFPGWLR